MVSFSPVSSLCRSVFAASLLMIATAGVLVAPVGAQDSRTVNEPVFPATCAMVLANQAISNGEPASETALDTARIQTALNTCGAGKGLELVASGANNAFLIAPLTIPNGVTLVVDAGVTVFGSRNPADYQVAGGGVETCGTVGTAGNGCNPLFNVNNGSTSTGAGVMGYGIINGRGGDKLIVGGVTQTYSWWDLAAQANGNGAQNNPIMMFIKKASNFTLYKITLMNSPMFHVKWQFATGFTAWGVKIVTPYTARNTDGIDPTDKVSDITITNSYLSDGDDDVAIGSSGAGNPASNISITNNQTYSGHGISIGSYTSGGVSNVLVNNINQAGNISDSNSIGLRIKSSADRGGLVNNITYSNVCIQNERKAIVFDPNYNGTTGGSLPPTFSNIVLRNITVLTNSQFQLQGYSASAPLGITFDNLNFVGGVNVTPNPQYANITLGPGPVTPVALQLLRGTGVTYTGNITNPAEPRYSCAASNFSFIAGELFLSATTPALTNQRTLALPNPASFTLNAVVEPVEAASVTPTSAIQFFEGTTQVGTATLAGNGTLATLTLNGVASGSHTYTARYPADTAYAQLNFGSVTVNVNTTATTTTLSVNPVNAVYGNPVTLTATVTPAAGAMPTGTVSFRNGGTVLGTAPVGANGMATFTTSSLPVGADSIAAFYGGSTNFASSDSSAAPVKVTITQAGSTTSLVASPANAAVGSSVTLTATVNSTTSQTPTGTVTFTDTTSTGSAVLGTMVLTGNTATLAVTTLGTGSHTITASYGGDGSFAGSNSSPQMVNIFSTSTTTTVGFTATTVAYGAPVTIIASLTPAGGTQTGTVTFYEGGAAGPVLGTAAVTTGSASLMISTLSVGAHSIVAVYGGDSNYTGSTSSATPLTVTQAGSATALAASTATPVYGSSETFTATVSGTTSGTPTGTVTFTDGGSTLASGVVLTGGVATYSTSALGGGAHSIRAVYSGDANYTGSTSAAFAVTVSAAATTTTLSAPAAITYGNAASLSATVASGAGTPGGSVQFFDGAALLGTAPLTAGTATLSATGLGGGTHTITAMYVASTNFAASTSAAASLTVNTEATTAALTATPSTVSFGAMTTLSVTISNAAATGTVIFKDGANTVGTATLSGGVASIALSNFVAGTHSVTAVYGGDSNFTGTTSPAVVVTVTQAVTMTSVAASPATISFGGSTTLTATVSPAAATGTVVFRDSVSGVLGQASIVNGTASLATTALGGGTHTITASYNGDANDAASTSAAINVTVNPVASAVSLSAAPATINFGGSTTLTAAISPAGATGSVTFRDGANVLGTQTVTNGAASFVAAGLSTGNHSLTASYSGDANDAASTSAAVQVTVNQTASTTTLSASPATVAFGSPTTLTATVGPAGATGVVTFRDGTTVLGTGTLAGGVATFPAANLAGGSHTLSASYAGDTNFSGSTSTSAVTVIVTLASSTTTVSASPTTIPFGSATTLTAAISPAVGTGTISFRDATAGGTLLGTATVVSGAASVTVNGLLGGAHAITATYSGDTNVGGSTSAPATVNVVPGPSGVTLASSATTTNYGAPLTLTATLAGMVSPTGSVTFFDGTPAAGTRLGTSAVVSAQAALTIATLTPGAHTLTAVYSGDANYAPGTSTAVTVTVTQGNASLALTANPPQTTLNQSFNLIATASAATGSTGTPTGSVTFSGDNGANLGTVALVNGVARLATSSATLGNHTYTAAYAGDVYFTPTAAPAITVAVKQLGSTAALQALPASGTFGSTTFSFSAAVTTANGGPQATGTVVFTDVTGGAGKTVVLGSAPLGNTAVLNNVALPAGMRLIVATYSGDANYTSSDTSANPTVVTVAMAATTTSVSVSPATSSFGTAVTLAATVVNSTGWAATGTVTFTAGAMTLGTANLTAAGTASITTSSLAIGSYNVVATYSGDGNFAASASTAAAVTVTQIAQTISLGNVPANLTYGATPLVIAASASSNLAVSLAVSGPATLNGSTLVINGAGTVTITATQAGNATYAAAAPVVQTITVAKAPLTVNVNNVMVAYGAAIPALTGSVTGLVNADNITASYATAATSASAPGTYAITATLNDPANRLANYTVSNTGGTLTIFTQTQTITFPAVAANVTYGAAPIALAATASSGLPVSYTVSGPGTIVGSTLVINGAGTVVVTANQPGNGNYGAASAVSQTVTVAKAVLTVTAASATRGFGSANPVFTGTLTGVVNGDNLTATYATNATASSAPGTYAITPTVVDPSGRLGNYNVTLVPGTLSVTSNSTVVAITVASGSSTVSFGTAVTFSIRVGPPSGSTGTPTGTVTFRDGTTVLGTAALNAGVATLTVATLSVGTHSVSASYAGDANFNAGGSSAPAVVTVTQLATTATLTATPNSGSFGTTINLAATVASNTATPATGTVTFLDGAASIGTGMLGANGMFTLPVATLAAGTHSITVVYGGDVNFTGSMSAAVTVTIAGAATTTTLTVPATIVFGAGANLAAAVSSTAGTVGGTVTFTDGSTTLGTATLTAAGTATFSATGLAVGTHSIKACFNAAGNFTASCSAASTLVVTVASATTTLTVSPATVGYGGTLTFTAKVTTTLSPVPTGTITLKAGTITLGTGTLVGGTAVITVTTGAALGAGTYSAVASYSGDANYAASDSSAAPTAFSVTAASTTAALTLSSSTAVTGATVTLSATLTSAAGTPTGTVTFLNGTSPVGAAVTLTAGGTATTTVSGLAPGTYNFTAVYAGAGNSGAVTSAPQTLTVVAPVSLSLAPPALTVAPGASASSTLTILPAGGYTGPVTVACSSPVAYLTCSATAPAAITGTSAVTSTITVTLAATLAGMVRPVVGAAQQGFSYAVLLPLGALLLLPLVVRRRRGLRLLTLVLMLAGISAAMTGCGSSKSGPAIPPPGTQAVTITVTAGATAVTTTLNVTH